MYNRERIEWVIVKDEKMILPNGDIIIVERCYDKRNKNVEVVHMRKYGIRGRRGFTLGKGSMNEFINILQKVMQD